MSVAKEITAGLAGGLAGGTAMAALMMAGQRAGLIETPPPVQIERTLEGRAGVADRTSSTQETALGMGLHMLLSAAFGGGYGLLRAAIDVPAVPGGPLYGLCVYALTFTGIGPTLGLTPSPKGQQPIAVGRQLMLHAVYGTVTALVARQVRQQ